jgi:endonuclease/exonuclease/phosphatase (EEP) superfamily protein YafD
MIARLFAAALTVALAAAAFILVWPQLFRLEWTFPVAQAVSFRALGIVGSVLVLLALLALAIFSVGARRFTGSIAIVFVVFGAVSLAVLASRGTGDEAFATKHDSAVTVLSWNTQGDAPGAAAIADLALDSDADVLTLPETSRALGDEVAALLTTADRPMTVLSISFNDSDSAASTTMLVSTGLGTYSLRDDVGNTSTLPTLVATPDDGSGPTFVAVHAMAPLRSALVDWHADLDWLAGICTGDTVMAGDFNATVDHMSRLASTEGASLGECADSAMVTNNAAVGTWPSTIPALLGTPIDHVLATDAWRMTGMRVVQNVDDAGSDHRPIVAQLSRS